MLKKTIISIFFSFFLLSIAYHPLVFAESIERNIDYFNIKDKEETLDKIKLLEDNSSKGSLLFFVSGLGLMLLWLLMFLKGNPKIISLLLLSFITTRWQVYGHKNGFLKTNVTEPFTTEQMFVYVLLVIFGISIPSSFFLRKGRSKIILVLLYHLFMGEGYRMGIFDDIV